MLYTLRYRQGSVGVKLTLVEADTVASAEEIGRKWCDTKFNRKYIGIEPAVVANSNILDPRFDGDYMDPTRPVSEQIKGEERAKSDESVVGVGVVKGKKK